MNAADSGQASAEALGPDKPLARGQTASITRVRERLVRRGPVGSMRVFGAAKWHA